MGTRKRSIVGDIGVAIFIIAFVCTVIAFFAPSWLVLDDHHTGAQLERLGLWTHCIPSLPNPIDDYQRRFHFGCRWVFDPFTYGYDQIQGFLMPPFIFVTQFFYALSFALVVATFFMVLIFFLCFGPERKFFVKLVAAIAVCLLTAGICGIIAIVVFAVWANEEDWIFGHENSYFGWSFYMAIVGSIASLISGAVFFGETIIQRKKRNDIKESRLRMDGSKTMT